MIRRPPRSPRTDTLFPYTTLFRSAQRRPRHPRRTAAAVALLPGAAADRWQSLDLGHPGNCRIPQRAEPQGRAAAHRARRPRPLPVDQRRDAFGLFQPAFGPADEPQSVERRVGKEWVSTGISGWSPEKQKKKITRRL